MTIKHSDFTIGCEFTTPTGRWRCTDVGTRVIVAIKLDQEDSRHYSGPPYGIVEHVFDEEDIACGNTLMCDDDPLWDRAPPVGREVF